MWETLLKTHLVIQKLEVHGVKYSKSSDTFYIEQTSKDRLSTVINRNNILICIAFLIGFKWQGNTGESTSYQLEIVKTVLHSLNLAIFLLGLVATWTFNCHSDVSCSMMNQARKFYQQRNGFGGSSWNTLLFQLIIVNIVSCVFAGLATITFTPFLCQVTPPHLIHSVIYPSQQFSLEFAGLCCVYIGTVGIFIAIKIAKLLFYICAVLYESQFILIPAYSSTSQVAGYPNSPLPNFQNSIRIYQKSFLFITQFCTFGVAFLPLIMTLGMCINIVTTLVCIKFHGSISYILVFACGGFDFATLVITVGLYGFSVVGFEASEEFKKYWSRCQFLKKIERKQLAACPPITLKVGAFFQMKRTTLPQALQQIVSFTTTLLILDE